MSRFCVPFREHRHMQCFAKKNCHIALMASVLMASNSELSHFTLVQNRNVFCKCKQNIVFVWNSNGSDEQRQHTKNKKKSMLLSNVSLEVLFLRRPVLAAPVSACVRLLAGMRSKVPGKMGLSHCLVTAELAEVRLFCGMSAAMHVERALPRRAMTALLASERLRTRVASRMSSQQVLLRRW